MKSPLLYLLEVFFCSGLLMAFYRLLLARKVAYVQCRRYLVAAVVLSVLLPAFDIPLYPARTVVYPIPLIAAAQTLPAEEPAGAPEIVEPVPVLAPVPSEAVAIHWPGVFRTLVYGLYLLTVAVMSGLFAAHLIRIARLKRGSRLTDCGTYTLAENPAVTMPFSFLRTVFLGTGYEGRRREIVLLHETSHVRHRHSAERIVVEAVRCLFWFNPFVWIAQRWLAEVQEWEVDCEVLASGCDLTEYRMIIFRQLFGYNPDIACGLNHSYTKNRFAMMTQFKKPRFACVRLGAAIPMVAGMMMLCSFTTKSPDTACPSQVSEIHISADGIYLNGERRSREEILDFVARERGRLSEADRAGMTVRLTADSLPARPAPDLEGLEQVPVLEDLSIVELLQESGDGCRFQEYHYLPVDDSKYRRGPHHTITDLKGTNITEWVRKNYMVVSRNPMFVIDGRLLTSQEYARWNLLEHEKYGPGKARSLEPRIYAGPEVGKRVGDPTVDVLVVYDSNRPAEASAPASGLANLSCPLRSNKPVAPFGPRRHPVNNRMMTHDGVDIAAAKGTPVVAAADGKVLEAGYDENHGNSIRIAHADGYTSMYAHLASCDVKQGQRVTGGQRIGTVGDTGRATGPHLHFELARDGRRLDPQAVFDFATGKPVGISGRNASGDEFVSEAVPGSGSGRRASSANVETRLDVLQLPTLILRRDGTFLLNGEPVTLAQIESKIKAQYESLPESDRERMYVRLAPEPGVRMGVVNDVKQALRCINALRISYYEAPDSRRPLVERVLPPVSGTSGVIKVVPNDSDGKYPDREEIRIEERNLYLVLLNGRGELMAGQPGRLRKMPIAELAAAVKRFVLNASDDPGMSEKRLQEFELPDGRKTSYPVSEGVVSILAVRDTPYEKYLGMQDRLSQAFAGIRDDVSQQWFGKSFAALDDAQRKVVGRAVPLKIVEAESRDLPAGKK